jgi:hypothetical protein
MARLIEEPGVREMVRLTEDGVVGGDEADEGCVPCTGAPGTDSTLVETTIPFSSTFPQLVTVTCAEIRLVGGNTVAGGEAGRVDGLGQLSPTVLTPPVDAPGTAGGDRPTAEMSS